MRAAQGPEQCACRRPPAIPSVNSLAIQLVPGPGPIRGRLLPKGYAKYF